MEIASLLFILTVLYRGVEHVDCHKYDRYTTSVLCSTQCGALCMENESYCDTTCHNQFGLWMTMCDDPGCAGTCADHGLGKFFNLSLLPEIPVLNQWKVKYNQVKLSWQPSKSRSQVLYAVQYKKINSQIWENAIYEIQTLSCTIDIVDVCSDHHFRVIAINRHGSRGFSNYTYISASAFHIDPVHNVTFLGRGIYYYPGTQEFMAIIQWDGLPGWDTPSAMLEYKWNDTPRMTCNNKLTNIMPIFERGTNTSAASYRRILMHINADAYGCLYQGQVRAETKCGLLGPWTNFTLDLTDCQNIFNFPCVAAAYCQTRLNSPCAAASAVTFSPPGSVENVSLCVEYGGVNSSMLIRLLWDAPTDLGSMGVIDSYTIRWGHVIRKDFPEPPIFTDPVPRKVSVKADVQEVDVPVGYDEISADYGFQVVPVAPQQQIQDDEWGLFDVYTVRISSNTSNHSPPGTVLLDEAGVRVVQIPNALSVDMMWQPRTMLQSPSSSTACKEHYSIQLGRIIRDSTLRPHLTDTTVQYIHGNKTDLQLNLQYVGAEYGFRIRSVGVNENVSDEVWNETELHIFKFQEDNFSTETGNNGWVDFLIVALAVTVVCLACMSAAWIRKKLHRRKKLPNLHGQLGADVNNYEIFRTQSSLSSLLTPAVVPDMWELPHSGIKVGPVLGQGAFGLVTKGRISGCLLTNRNIPLPQEARREGTEISVAIKMLKDDDDCYHRRDFLREIALMKKIGYHANVVSMLGCCTLCDPVCVVVEHMHNGDLQSYLKAIRNSMRERDHTQQGYVNRDADLLGPTDLLSFARQISIGMEFLAQKGFVHRDLAARNILVGRDKTVKIGDFGLARFVYDDAVYINRKGGRLPLKWMSIEAICELTFSSASDVWSFGVVLFELVTLGGTPYPTVDMHDLLRLLRLGYRMEKPPNCSWKLYNVMLNCWNELPKLRPSFTDLKSTLDAMLENECEVDYLSMDIDSCQYYYTVTCVQEESSVRYAQVDTLDDETRDVYESMDVSALHLEHTSNPVSIIETSPIAQKPQDSDSSEEETAKDHTLIVHEVQIERTPPYLEDHYSGQFSLLTPVQNLESSQCREHRDSGFDTSSYSGSSPNASPRTLSSRGSHKESIGMEDEVFLQDLCASNRFVTLKRDSHSLDRQQEADQLASDYTFCKKCLIPINEEFHFCDNFVDSDSTGRFHGTATLGCGNFSWKSKHCEIDQTMWGDNDTSVCSSSIDTLMSWDENTLNTYL
ncbi:uncharacterized protein LOC132546348 [Ylistrum balloti]|uniref:uncharacterized protein LOC132546348 n=1 Tax=Ylistrum balloti TaxID=509963 RepID=UPI002905EAC0|nr:uncharacterized protein LOC132546348 [Ylistrum balloti]